ncbi:hypothetical protein CRE_06766 [Caenorhabditis remanei]|uniref:Uncharacterized protein n=1 Tax=Caenorhabditis remanei TaxID=31234 RepID=E3MP11_CAERE|nr:hypothetical protein CRE_06766 [Caenorhabditis remanei]
MMPTHRVNKRTVFEDSDSEKEVEKPPKKKSNRRNKHEDREEDSVKGGDGDSKSGKSTCETASLDFENFNEFSEKVAGTSAIWTFLTIHGPYHHFFKKFGNVLKRDQEIRKFIRPILLEIHKKQIEFRDQWLPPIIRSHGAKKPTVDDVMKIVEEMWKRVFCIEVDGVFITLYKKKSISPLRNVFYGGGQARLICNNRTDVFCDLRRLCKAMRLKISVKQTEELRNALMLYCFLSTADFLSYTMSATIDNSSGALQIQGFRAPNAISNYGLHATFKLKLINGSDAVGALTRGRQSSLWTSLPCKERDNILELVFENGFIEELPEDAKSFLIDYVLDVRNKMRKILEKNSLRHDIESELSGNSSAYVMKLDDRRIERFLVDTLDNVFNTEHMIVFRGEWRNCVFDVIKTLGKVPFGELPYCSEIYESVCQKMNSSSLELISSYFKQETPDGGQSLLAHTLLQLLRFVVKLSLNTIRHVFHFDPRTHRVTYDGELDEEVTDFGEYDQAEPRFIKSEPFIENETSSINESSIKIESSSIDESSQSLHSTSSINMTASIPKKSFDFTPVNAPVAPVPSLPAGCDIRRPPPYFVPTQFQRVNYPMPLVRLTIISDPEEANGTAPSSSDTTRPSTVANETEWNIDDKTKTLEKWVDAYKIMLEWNEELRGELERAKEKLARFS